MEFSSTSLGQSASATAYCGTRRACFLAELKDFIRFPSVSAQAAHAENIKPCAAWLADHLRRIGMKRVTVVATVGNPFVSAESCHAPRRPTVLICEHYDMQSGIDTSLMRFAWPDDPIHAPNEKYHLPNFYKGISTSIHFMAEMGSHSSCARRPLRPFETAGAFQLLIGGIL
jgi:acetylornithine deacetylase/succinyl-diaminopimelate desuccinylase-like protein